MALSYVNQKLAAFMIAAASMTTLVLPACKKEPDIKPEPTKPIENTTMVITETPPSVTKEDLIAIAGNNFGSDKSKIKVRIGGGSECEVTAITNTEIKVIVSVDSKTGQVTVQKDAVMATSTNSMTVNDKAPAMAITKVPDIATIDDLISIEGVSFGMDKTKLKVKIGGGGDCEIVDLTSTEIKVRVADDSKTGPVTVQKDAVIATSTIAMTINKKAPAMAITNAPAFATVGDLITIEGVSFGDDKTKLKVRIGAGGECQIIEMTSTEIKAIVADDSKTGPITVQKDAVVATSTISTTVSQKAPAMAITKVPPSVTKEDIISVEGVSFGTDKTKLKVKIGDGECQIMEVSNTELKVLVAANATTGRVTVQKDAIIATSAGNVTVNNKAPAMAINKVPTSVIKTEMAEIGGISFGTDKTILKVKFGNGSESQIIEATDTELKVLVAENSTTGVVTVQKGSLVTTSAGSVVVNNKILPPVLTQVPTSVTKTEEAIVQGNNFGTDKTKVKVKINGVESEVTGLTDNQVKFIVDENSTTGPLTFQKDAMIVTSTGNVVVNNKAPNMSITGTPTTATKYENATINGISFGTDKTKIKVKFGSDATVKESEVISITDKQIIARVDETSVTGRVTVQKDAVTATSPNTVTIKEGTNPNPGNPGTGNPGTGNPGTGQETVIEKTMVTDALAISYQNGAIVLVNAGNERAEGFKVAANNNGNWTMQLVNEEKTTMTRQVTNTVPEYFFASNASVTSFTPPTNLSNVVYLQLVENKADANNQRRIVNLVPYKGTSIDVPGASSVNTTADLDAQLTTSTKFSTLINTIK